MQRTRIPIRRVRFLYRQFDPNSIALIGPQNGFAKANLLNMHNKR